MLLALGGVSVLGYALRQRALAGSHEQPSTDSWFAFAPVTTPDDVVAGRKLFFGKLRLLPRARRAWRRRARPVRFANQRPAHRHRH